MIELKKASTKAIKYACKRFHYAKSVPVNVFGYSVFENGEWCGVILFGSGANRSIGSPYGLAQGEAIELVRVALNGKQSNVSKPLSIALRLVKRDCPLAKLIVSYADLDQEHVGTIYQATNWIHEGTRYKNQRGAIIIHGKKVHPKTLYGKGLPDNIDEVREQIDPDARVHITKGKVKYLYPLDKKTRKQIEQLHNSYIKHASEA